MKKLIIIFILAFPIVGLSDIFPSWYPKGGFDVGQVITINRTSLWFDDLKYNLSPTVKVSTLKSKSASLADIKTGMLVGLKMTRFNNKDYVDHIYEMPLPKNDKK